MRRVSIVVLAVLLMVSAVGVAGCTKRKSKSKKSSSSSAKRKHRDDDDDNAAAGTTGRSSTRSPSATSTDPVGRACSELLDQINKATGTTWRLDDGQTQATPDSTRTGGARKCYFTMSGTAALPPGMMAVTLYRIDRQVDNGPDAVRGHAEKQANCTEKLPSPLSGTTLGVQCLQRRGGTMFDVQTTLSGQRGYVLVFLSMQPDKAPSNALQTTARGIGTQAAAVALGSL